MDDGIFVILGIAAIGLFLLGPIGFFLTLGARSRLVTAERRILDLQAQLLARVPRATREQATRQELAPEEAAPSVPQAETARAPVVLPEPEAAEPRSAVPPAPVGTDIIPPRSLEEKLGTRWAVWVGGLALSLGALLLVRYSIDQGWFGPAARVVAGLAFAIMLVAAGEALRRREAATAGEADAATARSNIPAVLTAAGTVAAFGAIYAAYALYHFIGPAVAFVALGAVGLACMVAAALHGPALAGLGLLGALAAPLLVSSDNPNPWPVAIYVPIITASAYGLARLRNWFQLALAAAAGALIWSAILVSFTTTVAYDAALVHGIVQLLLAIFIFVVDRYAAIADHDAVNQPIGLAAASVFALAVLAALQLGAEASLFDAAWVGAAALTVAILALTGLGVTSAAALTLAAGIALAVILRVWPGETSVIYEPWDFADEWITPRSSTLFCSFALLGGLGIAAGAGRRLWNGADLRNSIAPIYAGAMSLTPLVILGMVYLRFTSNRADLPFGAIAGGLALGFVVIAHLFREKHTRVALPALHLGLGVAAAAAFAALALGFVFVLDRGMLTVALALAALGAAYVDRRLDIPALRWGVAGFGLLVAGRLAWDPRIVGADLGQTPIFNWLLWGYGVPAFAFAFAGQLLHRRADDTPARIAQALAILFSAFLVFFEIRHALNGGDPYAQTSGVLEQGLMATSAFGFSIVLTRLDATRTNIVLRLASLGFGIMSFAIVLFGLLFAENPLFTGEPVQGGSFFNALLLSYGLPALLALLLARLSRGVRPIWYCEGAQLAALILAFALANLELRRAFQGPDLSLFSGFFQFRPISDAEWYAYSALWLGCGVLLLGFGIWRGSRQARLASAVLIVATVLKVFLFDLAGLEGILRALSFIGLGLVLIGIGLVYQKLVFARRPAQS